MLSAFSRKTPLSLAIAVIFAAGFAAGYWRYDETRKGLLADLVITARRCALAFDPREVSQLTGTTDDLARPDLVAVKERLIRLRQIEPGIRSVYLFRLLPTTGKISLLVDSGGDRATSPRFLETARAIVTDRPSTEGPTQDLSGLWVRAYAPLEASQGGKPIDILGIDVAAGHWRATSWSAAVGIAAYVWMLLLLPLATLVSTRRQNWQRDTLRNLTEAMEQGQSAVMIVALNQRIQYANAGFCRQVGYLREELIGREWREFQGFEAPPELIEELVATLGAGQPWSGEWSMHRKDGSYFPARGGVTPVKDRAGRIRSFVVVFEDMTEIRETESMLREAKERAEAGDRAKGQFLATMSHEVRTPLNGIVGFASLLLDTELTPEQQEFVATIRTSSETLIQLTGDILDYARIESGRLKLEPQPCDPRECVENALDLIAGVAVEKKIELLHWVDDSVPPAIVVDVGRLRQVLVNLVNNAVKFTASGEVEVRVRATSIETSADGTPSTAILEFSVRDTGIGISAQHHAKIFRPFSQVDESTTRRFGGTGLGLAICKNIVELMNGKISFVSEPGVGSTFTFTIRAPVHSAEDLSPVIPTLVHQRLAVVAESRGLRDELARLGERLGAEVIQGEMNTLVDRSDWNIAIVDISESIAVELAAKATPLPGLPPEKIIGLVSISLPPELRSALRTHFRVLLNKPPHQATLRNLLGTRTSATPLVSPATEIVTASYNLNVLIAEDNAVNQQLIQRVVTNLGCHWTAVSNGRAALEHLAANIAEVVLMDLHMPEMDGLTAIKKIRTGEAGDSMRGVWIIALTADARVEQRERTLSAGANDYLTKPVRLPELMSAFDRYVASVKQQHSAESSGAS